MELLFLNSSLNPKDAKNSLDIAYICFLFPIRNDICNLVNNFYTQDFTNNKNLTKIHVFYHLCALSCDESIPLLGKKRRNVNYFTNLGVKCHFPKLECNKSSFPKKMR